MSETYLITGAGGFVARHYLAMLRERGAGDEIVGVDILPEPPERMPGLRYRCVDLTDAEAVTALLSEHAPTRIVHLAAFSSVSRSWREPAASFVNNTNVFLNIVESVRTLALKARVLSVGSSEQYGDHGPADMPLREDMPVRPASPYAIARAAQESLSALYAAHYGVDIVMTRSFNHIGPGQRDVFVVPSFVSQLVAVADDGAPPVLHVGNVDVVRDFLDVRDVARAYDRILEAGQPGRIYNVCSGCGRTLREVIASIGELLGVRVELRVDAARMRPLDPAVIIGDHTRLRDELGWVPHFPLGETLRDMVAELRRQKDVG